MGNYRNGFQTRPHVIPSETRHSLRICHSARALEKPGRFCFSAVAAVGDTHWAAILRYSPAAEAEVDRLASAGNRGSGFPLNACTADKQCHIVSGAHSESRWPVRLIAGRLPEDRSRRQLQHRRQHGPKQRQSPLQQPRQPTSRRPLRRPRFYWQPRPATLRPGVQPTACKRRRQPEMPQKTCRGRALP